MKIDIDFDFNTEAQERDIDRFSPTLKKYHQTLWSKELPSGEKMELHKNREKYLEWKDFTFGSDAITHSYRDHKRKQSIIAQAQEHADEIFNAGCTIGAYTIFPNNRVNRFQTINQSRGTLRKIDDRFDLTLECVRRFYIEEKSPLYDTLSRYRNFFDLFVDFSGYVEFFSLQDLVLDDFSQIKFYLPFDDFSSNPDFHSKSDYLKYKNRVIEFIKKRNSRIKEWSIKNAK